MKSNHFDEMTLSTPEKCVPISHLPRGRVDNSKTERSSLAEDDPVGEIEDGMI